MFDRNNLEELAAYESTKPVVSLYLNLAPHLRSTPEAYRARLKSLLKEVAGQAADEDIAAIEDYFNKSFDWQGRSVAVFSNQAGGLWRVQTFAVPLRSSIYVGSRPFLLPLVRLMDVYGSYSVALVDQQTLRLLHVHLGELVATQRVEGEEVRRQKVGGGAAGRSRTRGEDPSSVTQTTVRSNLKTFADALAAFCKQHQTEHILIGGAEPTVNAFREMLGQPWQNCVESTFNISMRASDSEVIERSLEIVLSQVEAGEAELAQRVKALAARGGNGVVGVDDTLAAVQEGRVQTLVLVEGALPPEVAGPAIAHVLDPGGEIEFVGEESALGADRIGALLRY
ncbi:MAG: hypothetical protein GX484_00505 [Chloroflexi bacterium]|nr:hypothetical protein [Chloroflexota bacterium]